MNNFFTIFFHNYIDIFSFSKRGILSRFYFRFLVFGSILLDSSKKAFRSDCRIRQTPILEALSLPASMYRVTVLVCTLKILATSSMVKSFSISFIKIKLNFLILIPFYPFYNCLSKLSLFAIIILPLGVCLASARSNPYNIILN